MTDISHHLQTRKQAIQCQKSKAASAQADAAGPGEPLPLEIKTGSRMMMEYVLSPP